MWYKKITFEIIPILIKETNSDIWRGGNRCPLIYIFNKDIKEAAWKKNKKAECRYEIGL